MRLTKIVEDRNVPRRVFLLIPDKMSLDAFPVQVVMNCEPGHRLESHSILDHQRLSLAMLDVRVNGYVFAQCSRGLIEGSVEKLRQLVGLATKKLVLFAKRAMFCKYEVHIGTMRVALTSGRDPTASI